VQSLLDQVLGVEISTGAINAIRSRLSESLATLVEEATEAIRRETEAHMDANGGPIGNADGNNPEGKRGGLWVMATPTLAVLQLALRCFLGLNLASQAKDLDCRKWPFCLQRPTRADSSSPSPLVLFC
jgi:hypothetical protein